jgi:hypothetical protein
MEFSLVLERALAQVAGHSDIEGEAAAGDDVSEIVPTFHGGTPK